MPHKIKKASTLREVAIQTIQNRYGLKHPREDSEIDSTIDWRPSVYWRTRNGVIACEVSDSRPRRPIIDIAYSQIVSKGFPVRILVAYLESSNSSAKNLRSISKDEEYLQSMGIGLLKINDAYEGQITYHGISLPLFVSVAEIDLKRFTSGLKKSVSDVYELYINSPDPSKGVQELGQLIESVVKHLAVQAKARNHLLNSKFNPLKPEKYKQSLLIDELTSENIISRSILGRCRGFCDDRNLVSHRSPTFTDLIKKEKKLKEKLIIGLSILEDLPNEIKKSGYKFKF